MGMKWQDAGMNKLRNDELVKWWDCEMDNVGWFNAGLEEYWSRGNEEWWNGGMVDWNHSELEEWWNAVLVKWNIYIYIYIM